MIDVFAEIRSLPIGDIIERYGLHPKRGGMLHCPGSTHEDKTPSAKIYDDHIHCFSCGKSWDAVALVGEMHNLTPIEAARMIDRDFMLNLFPDAPPNSEEIQRAASERAARKAGIKRINLFELWANAASSTLATYLRSMEWWIRIHAPQTPDETEHPLFVHACHNLDYWTAIYQDVFIDGELKERVWLFGEHKEGIINIARFIESLSIIDVA